MIPRSLPLALGLALVLAAGVTRADEAAVPTSQASATSPASPVDRVLVKVDGRSITVAHLLAHMDQRGMHVDSLDKLPANLKTALINEMINLALMANEAERLELTKRSDVIAGMEVAQQQYLAEKALGAAVASQPVQDAELKAAYDAEVAGRSGDEVKARHILLKTEADALAVIAELDKGANFAELAKTRSADPSAAEGGDLGWIEPSSLDPAFDEAMKGMEKGKHSAKPVKTEFGWHVLLVEDRRAVPQPSLEQLRPELVKAIQRKRVQEYLAQTRAKANIQPQPNP